MEGYVMESKRLTPTIVGKIASKRLLLLLDLNPESTDGWRTLPESTVSFSVSCMAMVLAALRI